MSRGAAPLVAFNRVGDRSRLPGGDPERSALRPALFGPYRDLGLLRGDFPLVLESPPGDMGRAAEGWVTSLSDRFDRLQREFTRPGAADEERRRLLLALEEEIRRLAAGGQRGNLGQLWKQAAETLLETAGNHRERLRAQLQQAEALLPFDGALEPYGPDVAWQIVRRAWFESETRKAVRLFDRTQRLARRLQDILEGDFLRSRAARAADRLARTLGASDQALFDFTAMERVLKSAPAAEPMPPTRRRRIQEAIDTLLNQPFVVAGGLPGGDGDSGHGYEFDDCAQAVQAFRNRLPQMCALVRAIGIAELEIDNHYDEAVHGPFFAQLGEDRLGSEDLHLFPSPLVRVARADPAARAALLTTLEAGLPLKLVVEAGDALGQPSLLEGKLALGRSAQHLARMALGLGDVFVLQAAVASLYRLRDEVLRGVSVPEPALFHLFTGDDQLTSAAAADSRLFPSFVHDPSAGPRQRDRFRLPGNPQPTADWPEYRLECEGRDHERREQDIALTAVDFMAADPRFQGAFAAVSEDAEDAAGDNAWVPLADYLELSGRSHERAVPYIFVIDADERMYRAVVDENLVDVAHRCRSAWRELQELAGIANSHAEAAVNEARSEWQRQARPMAAPVTTVTAEAAAAATAATAPAVAADVPPPEPEPEPQPGSDDPWIETLRCTTCNECTQINDRMFAYNADKRAYIADPDAGTYRELVQAAETCQVAIIHPGKPRNPDEPGLEELLKRAEPFL